MPKGKTEKGVNAEGAIIIIYYNDNFLMAQETKYLADEQDLESIYHKAKGKTLQESYLYKGTTHNEDDVSQAKKHFGELTEYLEELYPEIPHITFADVKDSRRNPGFISAKPRYVAKERRTLYGFPKGSFEQADLDLKITAFRECQEETGISLRLDKIDDKYTLVPTGRGAYYAVYHCRLTKQEYEDYLEVIKEKNKAHENELHNIQFIKIPKGNPRNFFINVVSKEAYERTIQSPRPFNRKTYRRSKNNAFVKNNV